MVWYIYIWYDICGATVTVKSIACHDHLYHDHRPCLEVPPSFPIRQRLRRERELQFKSAEHFLGQLIIYGDDWGMVQMALLTTHIRNIRIIE